MKENEMKEEKPECEHKSPRFPMPDSLAEVCPDCGQVWVAGEPWEYKSGNITDWIDDMIEADKKKGKPDGK